MKPVCRVVVGSFARMLAYPLSLSAQWNKQPYTEWPEKEATKLLNDSPWVQTQALTDTSQMTGYQPPGNDGFGARYIFPRLVDGKAFITPETGDILFHSEPVVPPC